MRDLTITEFRRQCLTLMEALPEEGVVVTKHGRAIARVSPLHVAREGKRVSLPLFKSKGKRGPLCPNLETPYDLVLD